MILIARCPSCRCPVTLLEISDNPDDVKSQQLLEKWRKTGAIIESVQEPPLPDEMFIHAPGCDRIPEYRHGTNDGE